ncbi:phage holin family protein [Romboutsia sp. 1001216sp1]|uniref:phage holin family protein n=1 Tax=Romboutsia TaxID=1501226 RepID=UPI000A5EF758|nr:MULTISPECIES: phage holin family protein [Romboutsia]MDB8793989.1 phage holin family protein [Romboutsia sp. 1001216sp1]MDB8796916.1 phage holin family protein [Romboutsia sp. 1001216sp1]MDB8800130.1 phage holin family protein [Romboutsia sp. 1001216sp1]
MAHDNNEKRGNDNSLLRWIGRFILVAVILMITSFVTPGFSINGIWSFLIAAVVISGLDYLAELLMGVDASPFGKGIKGFIIAAIIIYLAQFLVPDMGVTIIGAILAAIVIGVLDAIFPARAM